MKETGKTHSKRTTNDLNFVDCNALHDSNDILDKQVFKCQKGYSGFASEAANGGVLNKKLFLKLAQYSQENTFVGASF